MALKEISLTSLVEALDDEKSDYADFFRPMLGYDAILTLYDGIQDDIEPLLVEIEDETGYEFPPDLISFYICTNGGVFGDLELFPISKDSSLPYEIHRLNAIDKSLKESLGLDKKTLLVGKYTDAETYVICTLKEDGVYAYQIWDGRSKSVNMEFEYLVQLVALEVAYVADNDGFMEFANKEE